MIITAKTLDSILRHSKEAEFKVKVDFSLKELSVKVNADKAFFENGAILCLKEKLKPNFCYLLHGQELKPIAFFSEESNKFYKLLPTQDWPTVCIGSVPMHRVNSPRKDAENKIDLLKPYGSVLDTCMGLGYTAILAAKTAQAVITFEQDENISFMAKINPLSQELFSAKNIEIRPGDISLEIKKVKDAYFDCIIHDPPTFKLSPQLYSISFYQELKRVLKKGGRFFHYTPLYKVRQGVNFPAKIKEKLKNTGFAITAVSRETGGIVCKK